MTEEAAPYVVAKTEPTEAIKAFLASLATAQGMFEPIERNREVNITMKSGGTYKFKYAELAEILKKTRVGLSSNGLSLRGRISPAEKGGIWLQSILAHAEGHEDTAEVFIDTAGLEDIKTLGARISYLRRYIVSAQLGIASDDDIDEDGQEAGDISGGGGVARGYTSPAPARARPTPAPRAVKTAQSSPTPTPDSPAQAPTAQRQAESEAGKVASEAAPEAEVGEPITDGQAKWVMARLCENYTPAEAMKWLGTNGVPDVVKMTTAQFAALRPAIMKLAEF